VSWVISEDITLTDVKFFEFIVIDRKILGLSESWKIMHFQVRTGIHLQQDGFLRPVALLYSFLKNCVYAQNVGLEMVE